MQPAACRVTDLCFKFMRQTVLIKNPSQFLFFFRKSSFLKLFKNNTKISRHQKKIVLCVYENTTNYFLFHQDDINLQTNLAT